ncbi:MAG: DUF881 domain-containing protein [Candidatus Dormibacteraceae bacterium]
MAHARTAAALGLLAALLAFMVVVQLRSQDAVLHSLAGQDPSSLAFLIDDLHKANETLAASQVQLDRQRRQLSAGGEGAATRALDDEVRRLEILEGLASVRGPGVEIRIDAPLSGADLQAATDNLRIGGAEAIVINGVRIVTGTSFRDLDGRVIAGGTPVHGPWTFWAIGSPSHLGAVAAVMTQKLRGDPRVRSIGYTASTDVVIVAVIRQHPFVYGTP